MTGKLKKDVNLLIVFACAVLLVLISAASVYAEEGDLDSGTYYGVPWRITSEGVLLIGEADKEYTMGQCNSGDKDWTGRSDVKSVKVLGKVRVNGGYHYIFYSLGNCTTMDLSGLDTSGMTSMYGMFFKCDQLTNLDLSGFDTSNVTDMYCMFYGCSGLTSLDFSKFNTSNVTNMSEMFSGCSGLTSLDLSKFNTNNVTSMSQMFSGCSGLTSLDLSKFNTGNVTNMSDMFSGCSSLPSLDLRSFNTEKVNSEYGMSNMFAGCKGLESLNLKSFNTSNVKSMKGMFSGCSGLTNLSLSNFDTNSVTDMSEMFSGCSGLTNLDVSRLDTGQVKTMSQMFSGCSSLASLKFAGIDTSGVLDMSSMFSGCKALTELDISSLNTGHVTDMGGLFADCSGLSSLTFTGCNTESVENMSNMFLGCSNLKYIDVPQLKTKSVKYMDGMFSGCKGLTTLDLSEMDTESTENMSEMFKDCSQLQSLDVTGFTIDKVTNMRGMFSGCSGLTSLDVSSFKTNKVDDMQSMFKGCDHLTVLDLSEFDTCADLIDMSNMFDDCTNLVELNLSSFDTSSEDYNYLGHLKTIPQSVRRLALGSNSIFPRASIYNCKVLERVKDLSGVATDGPEITRLSDYDGRCPGWYKVSPTIDPKSVSLDRTELRLKPGADCLLDAVVHPANVDDATVVWSSSDSNIVEVEPYSGLVTARAESEKPVIITATTEVGGKTATCLVTVDSAAEDLPQIVRPTGITLDYTEVDIPRWEKKALSPSVSPADATDKRVIWSTKNRSVATVNENGVITAVGKGSTTITATTAVGNKKAECVVTVTDPLPDPTEVIAVESISLSQSELSVDIGETKSLTATVTPSNATYQAEDIKWSSSDEEIATVNNGKVTGVGNGEATITVKVNEGKENERSATCKVTVSETVAVKSVSVQQSLNLKVGKTHKLQATVLPENASNKNVSWSSDNEDVAKVEQDGTVKAIGGGKANITVTTEYGGYTATCEVNVVVPVTGITLDTEQLDLAINESQTLIATVLPEEFTNQNVVWSSSDYKVATVENVNNNGKVTRVGEGTALITATTEDGGFVASCWVGTNVIRITDVSLDAPASLLPGETAFLTPKVSPENATNQEVASWKSSEPAVADIDDLGQISALSPGETTITATMKDGGITASCIVRVMETDISNADITLSGPSFVYDGKAKVPEVTVKMGEAMLDYDKDYALSYSNNVNAGTAMVTVTGKGNYKGSVSRKFGIATRTLQNREVQIENSSIGYKSAPRVKVIVAGKQLKAGSEYAVWCKNNQAIGKKVAVKVTGKGNYRGSVSKTVTVVPASIKINPGKVKRVKRRYGFKLKWNKIKSYKPTGYRVEMATDRQFKHIINKTRYVKATKKRLSGFDLFEKSPGTWKKGQTYYIRICVVKGHYVGKWSNVLSYKHKY